MKNITKMPLYLGLAVLVGTVLVSAATIGGQKSALTYQKSKAAGATAVLSMSYSAPNLVSINLAGDKEIAGLDVTIKYDKDKVTLLPSTLTGGPSFTASGVFLDEKNALLSFSALPKNDGVKAGIVATFKVLPKINGDNVEANLQFEAAGEKTAVIEKAGNSNILTAATGIKFNISSK